MSEKRFRPIQTFFLFLGSVFALLLITVGVGGYLITGPAPRGAGATPILVTQEAAESLDHKIEQFQREIAEASAMAGHREVTLVITEEEITSKAAQLAAAGRFPVDIDYVQIHFSDGRVCGFALADLGIDVQVGIQARIGVNEGKPDIKIESLNFGRLPISGTLIDQVMTALMRQMEEPLENIPIELQEITIENGEMIIGGITK